MARREAHASDLWLVALRVATSMSARSMESPERASTDQYGYNLLATLVVAMIVLDAVFTSLPAGAIRGVRRALRRIPRAAWAASSRTFRA